MRDRNRGMARVLVVYPRTREYSDGELVLMDWVGHIREFNRKGLYWRVENRPKDEVEKSTRKMMQVLGATRVSESGLNETQVNIGITPCEPKS
jgi:predicted SpoU family rRNA methylase